MSEASSQIFLHHNPDEATYNALQEACRRQKMKEFRTLYATRAEIEGKFAQAVRTCELQRAHYHGTKKLRIQALCHGHCNKYPSCG